MALSKRAFGQIIVASARSTSPMDEDTLREIAVEHGDDPDLLVERHNELREDWRRSQDEKSGPMPFIL